MAETTFRPDAHPETSSVDGYTRYNTPELSWSLLRAAAGTEAFDSLTLAQIQFRAHLTETNKWFNLNRGFLLFDISSISSTDIIYAATIKLYGNTKTNTVGGLPSIVITSSNPASDTALVAADQTTLGTAALSNVILWDDYVLNDWNYFSINIPGRAVIEAAQASDGIVKFGVRESTYDRLGIPPPWGSINNLIMSWLTADDGVTFAPQLIVGHIASTSLIVTTEECTDTIAEQTTGHGTLWNKGDSEVTQHGHVWATSVDPDTGDNLTTNGALPNLGQFTSEITGLTPNTTYYVRAYATNSEGTVYGGNVTIGSSSTIDRDIDRKIIPVVKNIIIP